MKLCGPIFFMTYLQGGEGGVWHSPHGPPSLGSTTGKSAIFMRRRVGFQDFLTESEKKNVIVVSSLEFILPD